MPQPLENPYRFVAGMGFDLDEPFGISGPDMGVELTVALAASAVCLLVFALSLDLSTDEYL